MSMILKASIWAAVIILIALLGTLGILPKNVAEHTNIFLPALATAVLILPATSERCGLNLWSKDA